MNRQSILSKLKILPYKIDGNYLVIRKCYKGWFVQYWDYEHNPIIKIQRRCGNENSK